MKQPVAMKQDKRIKNIRILYIYSTLIAGKPINKQELANRFGVDERSIQRDIDDIRSFLNEAADEGTASHRNIFYDRASKLFAMNGDEEAFLNNDEILAVSKILLESRAFTKQEIDSILDKLVAECVPVQNRKVVSDLIANEKFHYVELTKHTHIKTIWLLGEAVRKGNLLKIEYHRQYYVDDTVERLVQPLSLMYSEYYFYLIANIMEKTDTGLAAKFQYPAVFRIDRIDRFTVMQDLIKIPYADRFEEGIFRKRVQFMTPGKLLHVRFRYQGVSPEPVLDRLPTAVLENESDGWYTFSAELFGTGIMMWFLSQGSRVEVLGPASLREAMIQKIRNMMELYEEHSL